MKETLLNLIVTLSLNLDYDITEMANKYLGVINVPLSKLPHNAYVRPVYEPKQYDLVFLDDTVGVMVDDFNVFYVQNKQYPILELVDNVDVKMFGRVSDKRDTKNLVLYHFEAFKKYQAIKPIVEDVAFRKGLPAELLLNLLYTESKFNHRAVSHTGVRGIAMITRSTAKRFGIDTSSTVGQIEGMAKILNYLISKIDSKTYSMQERYKLASFCYNRGMKYYYLARKELRRKGIPITYKNTMKELQKYRYCNEGIKYVEKLNKQKEMFV